MLQTLNPVSKRVQRRTRWKQQQQKIAENKSFLKVFVKPLAGAPVGRSGRGLDHRDPDVLVVILVPNLSPDFKNPKIRLD